jgi:hypothetical protein
LADRKETLTVTKGDEIALALPPKTVHVLELKQARKGEPIYDRADLALSPRELKITDGKIAGVVHNIGVKEVDDVVVALVDRGGKTLEQKSLGRLAAPLDLHPKRIDFHFAAPAGVEGLSVVVDPAGRVAEIFEGNNRLRVVPAAPAAAGD